MWEVVDSGQVAVQEAMDRDLQLLHSMEPTGTPIFHSYDFLGDSATFGYFIKPFTLLNEEGVAKRQLSLGKRATGGGIIFHLCDLAFSIILPKSHEGYMDSVIDSYKYINAIVAEAVTQFVGKDLQLLGEKVAPKDSACGHFCMANPTIYDVLVDGKKVAGSAMRRLKNALLYQGSITLSVPPADFLEDVLLPNTEVASSMKANSYPLLGEDCTSRQLQDAKNALRDGLQYGSKGLV